MDMEAITRKDAGDMVGKKPEDVTMMTCKGCGRRVMLELRQ